ncbi:hypothetical protein POVWA2_010270 [Plasmodium ovale wallikeri]|uniref:Uncharacterized protein n=1 Tax=Plasmodium ovale wallikeri TaxID=864142 RepID=A0A1A8YLW2_PLAOA|nr:hypothetical protein POVWA2_010270 [Plasmodium ovale wallikeri]
MDGWTDGWVGSIHRLRIVLRVYRGGVTQKFCTKAGMYVQGTICAPSFALCTASIRTAIKHAPNNATLGGEDNLFVLSPQQNTLSQDE